MGLQCDVAQGYLKSANNKMLFYQTLRVGPRFPPAPSKGRVQLGLSSALFYNRENNNGFGTQIQSTW